MGTDSPPWVDVFGKVEAGMASVGPFGVEGG
jgi:hypothetical protein